MSDATSPPSHGGLPFRSCSSPTATTYIGYCERCRSHRKVTTYQDKGCVVCSCCSTVLSALRCTDSYLK